MYGHEITGLNLILNRIMSHGYVGSGFVTKIAIAKNDLKMALYSQFGPKERSNERYCPTKKSSGRKKPRR